MSEGSQIDITIDTIRETINTRESYGSQEDQHNAELLSSVLATIQRFKSRNWIDDKKEQDFLKMLTPRYISEKVEREGNKQTYQQSLDKTTKKVYQRLKSIRRQKHEEEKENKQKENTKPIMKSSLRSSANELKRRGETVDPITKSNQIHASNSSKDGILRPQDLSGKLSREECGNLFVEMCFFARLCFIQPPSCLKCAYNDAECDEKENRRNPNASEEAARTNCACNNLVIWRINADKKHLLHPDKLDDNIIVVTCPTAQAWIKGDTVHNMKWDVNSKKLIKIK